MNYVKLHINKLQVIIKLVLELKMIFFVKKGNNAKRLISEIYI